MKYVEPLGLENVHLGWCSHEYSY